MEFAAAKLRREDEHNLVIVSAWYVEAIRLMTRKNKQLPKLARLLHREPVRQTPEQHKTILAQLSQQYGFPLRHVKKD